MSGQLESYQKRSGFVGYIRKKLFEEKRYRLNSTNTDLFQRTIGTPEVISKLNWGLTVEGESLVLCDISGGRVFLYSSTYMGNTQIKTFLDGLVNLEIIDSYEEINEN
jgi:hypothetical protein